MSKKKTVKYREDEQLEKDIKDLFKTFDRNNDKSISAKELGRAMRFLGMNVTKRDIDDAMRQLDKNGNGQIEYKEFLQYMKKELKRQKTPEDEEKALQAAFAIFDRDNNGYIDEKELTYVMTNLGEKLTDSEIKDMMRQADVDGDGKINYEEFTKLWCEAQPQCR